VACHLQDSLNIALTTSAVMRAVEKLETDPWRPPAAWDTPVRQRLASAIATASEALQFAALTRCNQENLERARAECCVQRSVQRSPHARLLRGSPPLRTMKLTRLFLASVANARHAAAVLSTLTGLERLCIECSVKVAAQRHSMPTAGVSALSSLREVDLSCLKLIAKAVHCLVDGLPHIVTLLRAERLVFRDDLTHKDALGRGLAQLTQLRCLDLVDCFTLQDADTQHLTSLTALEHLALCL
jgi:hypothetical protein